LAAAQTLGEMNAAMNMSNTLNGQSVGGGNYRSTYIAPQMPPNAPLFPTGMYAPAAPAPAPMPELTPAAPPVKKILVLTGEQIKCHVMGTLLEDIHYEYRPESEKGEYYDDGTHGDLQPNDNIYSNISARNDVLSAEANRVKLLYLRMLELCEETNPLEFFRIPVATEEPLSTLPRMSDEEKDRDETFLRQWHRQFLTYYRQDPEDPMSDFYPIFVPSPPRTPETPAPPNDQYNANAFFLDAMIQQIKDNAVAPAIEQPQDQTGGAAGGGRSSSGGESGRSTRSSGGGGYSRSGGSGGGAAGGGGGYAGDRWGQLRQDAKTYGSTYGAGTSRYFR
jgi:hypothetical protein